MAATIKQQIKYHLDNKKFCKVIRQVAKDTSEYSDGYIVDSSPDFVLMQEVGEFSVLGYLVFPVSSISQIRFNNNDKYYDRIMHWEKQTNNVSKKYQIDLDNWTSIFKSVKKAGLNVIIENENPGDDSFDIGPINKVTKTAVYIRYFNAQGYLNLDPTKIAFDKITIMKFDNKYVNVFSKYLRQRKSK
jgi:hypothetical protein